MATLGTGPTLIETWMTTNPIDRRQRRTSSIVLSACILVMMFVMGWSVAQGNYLMGPMWLLISGQAFVALTLIRKSELPRASAKTLQRIGIGMVPVIIAIAIIGFLL